MNQIILNGLSLEGFKETLREILQEELRQKSDSPENLGQEQAMGIVETAQWMGLSRNTIYEYTSRRKIPFYKKGKKLFFFKSELQVWIQEGRQKTSKEIEQEAREYVQQSGKGEQHV